MSVLGLVRLQQIHAKGLRHLCLSFFSSSFIAYSAGALLCLQYVAIHLE